MTSFLQRWLPWIFGKVIDRPSSAPAPSTAPVERRAPSLSTGDDAQASAELVAISARRPLISSAGAVVGFEFRIGEGAARNLKRQTDAHARGHRVAALFASAHLIVQSGRIGFVRMPAQWLMHALDAEVGAGILIGLESTSAYVTAHYTTIAVEDAVLALRAKGVQVGWEVEFGAKVLPDFVMLRQGANAMSTLLDSMSAWPPELRGLPVLVTDIWNVEELEMALYNGVAYACGALDRKESTSEPSAKQPVPPEVRRVGLLLSQLVSGVDTDVIVGHIKGDVGLSYRLLSRVNSASYAQLGSCASVEQAVLMLGRYELYRWLSMLLVQFAGSRRASSALQEMALWRSRMLELLAIENHEAVSDQFFTLGLASMLGLILKISQAEVVSALNLPPWASQALLEQGGPWFPYLQIVTRVEAHTLDQSADLAAQFGGTARLLALSDQAWRWAAEQAAHGASNDAAKAV